LTHLTASETPSVTSATSSSAAPNPVSLSSTYVHLRDDRSAALLPVTPSFWQELATGQRPELHSGRLVLQMDGNEDWSTWEMHPAGDELVILISGRVEFVLEVGGERQTLALSQPGELIFVPRGVWHTARMSEPCSLIFITPGEGTDHKPVEADARAVTHR
jgi:mannose-6-phosphate isomerase-like protein (cupin superfamily)